MTKPYAPVEMSDHVDEILEQWRRELPRLDRSPMGVVGRISRLDAVLQRELEEVFAKHGLNGGEFDVLASLRRSGRPYRLTPGALSRALMVTTGGMTKRLHSLEVASLVRRRPDPGDRRSSTVELTAAGRKLVDGALRAHVANEERLLAGLDPRQREQLAGLLRVLALSLGDGR